MLLGTFAADILRNRLYIRKYINSKRSNKSR